MPEAFKLRELSSMEEAHQASRLITKIWGEERIVTPALLRAMSSHGNPVIVAWSGGEMVGAQMGFLGMAGGRVFLHSHITGVAPKAQHRGVGFLLKVAQRNWCLRRGIDTVTWTFDPMVARNAYFNLSKLGAVADRFHPNFYGPMNDAFNRGDRSDRLEVRWELGSEAVIRALEGRSPGPKAAGAAPAVDQREGGPERNDPDADRVLIRIPTDYHGLRSADLQAADAWRDTVGGALQEYVGRRGYRAVGFLREGAYLLERG
jgi:predicted GNAT superfamily acetyltransferase